MADVDKVRQARASMESRRRDEEKEWAKCDHRDSRNGESMLFETKEPQKYRCSICDQVVDISRINKADANEAVATISNLIENIKILDPHLEKHVLDSLATVKITIDRLPKVYDAVRGRYDNEQRRSNNNNYRNNDYDDIYEGYDSGVFAGRRNNNYNRNNNYESRLDRYTDNSRRNRNDVPYEPRRNNNRNNSNRFGMY